MAISDHTDDKISLSMTKGALLFGVPNQGMKSQQLISLLQEDDLPAVYTASLLDERYGSKLRTRRVYDFYRACSRNDTIVYVFYETEKTSTVCRVCTLNLDCCAHAECDRMQILSAGHGMDQQICWSARLRPLTLAPMIKTCFHGKVGTIIC